MLGGFQVTTAWRVLGLQMEETLSRYGTYRAYNQGGNGTWIVDWVAHFSTPTVPFPASKSAVVR
jgi:hypothetical protein